MPEDITASEWSHQAVKVLNERYFLKDKDGKAIETVEEMCWRVAWELARAEVKYGMTRKEIEKKAREFYKLMLSREFLPNSPTLMNAGKNNGLQYSACYVIPVPDSLEGIFDGVKWQGLIHQSGGGTGFSFSRLRPKGARVKSTMGIASGPVSFMKIYNEATQQIKQGGTRRGANMGILRVDHPDILEFIHCKDDDAGISNFNISVTVTDRFMDALAKDGEYDLIAPNNGEVTGKLSARRVWNEIAESAWKTGDPGLVFIDRINHSSANPIRAEGWEVESTNPCGEQPLYPFDACNLGSIFLNYFVTDSVFNWDKLREVTRTAVRMLDNVIEMNPFPLEQIKDTVMNIRRIGLGVGGWADMLVSLGIPYDSDEALILAEKMMKFINAEGHKMSEELAAERGPFPLWRESIYKKPIRNSTVTTIAPTGSISILANTSSGVEPLFAVAYRHIVKSENRELTFVNPLFEKVASDRGFNSGELMEKVAQHGTVREISEIPEDVRKVFGTAHEIEPQWHVKTQAAFQKYTDNGVSKTINLRHDATVSDVERAYKQAWESGCMGITVFRDGSKSEQVLNLGTKKSVQEIASSVQEQAIKPRPVKVEGATYRIETPLGSAFITVNHDADGNPFEVFVIIGKAGSEVSAMAEALGRLISTTLRFGNHMPAKERAKELMDQLHGIGGSRSVGFGPNKVRSLPDAIAKAIGMHFGLMGKHDEVPMTNSQAPINNQLPMFQVPNPVVAKRGDLCPSCGEASLVFEEGCKKCYGCGYSEC
ncbi:ribonucleoside-diphosphate reductase, adenosylcobalamin-dependent [candidate division Kazan bacterium RIFCSPLOWO2_01_FULL_48_13]|uniref:Vitamin B12-dependent ribonucleotide reductase n=1 Tax=candidate division Kazan bacterium RIFCSPLOWO2_01_FULL_48_13 TaxID=1798539 RepID=A0A1F4PMX5_UNCK3|nr:MAG: ribonucleoside-diphosphate reductase, adenosylcobalamin-dependent [candidate division Kazan bacterium RIFCSPLOWO2_01_FULL_48_13]